MELKIKKRKGTLKSELKQLRREGDIPAVLYGPQGKNEIISVSGADFQTALRKVKSGCLSTTIFVLNGDDKPKRAILKDIQYQRTTYQVIHVDFEELHDNVPVNVNIPIQCIGMIDCPGIKLGGVLRQVIRQMRVQCLPKDIPSEFVLNVSELGITQTKRLRDIVLPKGVKSLAKPEAVAVVIAKR